MADLIRIDGTRALLDVTVSQKIAAFEKQIKEMKAQEDLLKAMILDEMERRGIIGLETDELKVSYVAATDRETFDSKALRADHPELYDEYVRISPVKSSVRIKVK